MTLPAGERLGNYQVIALVGAGGMGEVYRASDSKLGRVVALKVLPSGFHMDDQRMARFQREAQILAAPNHPNIATIHGLEDSGPIHALVMELVEGPTLADRIAEGPLPLEEALAIAAQIAEALEYAHERGIIHRDLKPANVKITPDGKVKVLDFGLAKALEDSPDTQNISTSPTLTMGATRAGIILGTAAYMPPEQAKGKSVDRRGDVWSFGVVLYEMLTGKQLYTGETASEVMAAVIMNKPDVNFLPAATPAPIRQLIRRCITRDPHLRLRDIGEARIAINDYLANPAAANAQSAGSSATIIAATQQSPAKRALPWAIAALTTALAIIAAWAPWRAAPQVEEPTRLSAEIGAAASMGTPLYGPTTIISPDGTKFAFVATSDADKMPRLYVRQRDRLEATPLAGTENARDPFFSPDGDSIAFFSDSKLKRISVLGGAVVTLCDAPSDRGGAWSEDGTIVFARSNREGLSRVSDAGGTPELLTKLDSSKGEITHRWPQVLPRGNAVLFTAHNSGTNFGEGSIYVQDIKTGERKLVHSGGMFARYVPGGHLIFAGDATLFAIPFDLARLQTTGSPTPFLENVAVATGTGSAQFDVSKTGTLIYVAGNNSWGSIVVDWMDKEGKFQPVHLPPGDYIDPSISPDGKKLALIVRDRKSSDLWVYDWARDTFSRVTFSGRNQCPVWTPDGRHIVYSSGQDSSQPNLFWVKSDGTGTPERLTQDKSQQLSYSISKDGKLLAFNQLDYASKTGTDIWTLSLEGSDKPGWKPPQPQVFLNTPFFESSPAFSPDGRWLAYSSDDTGTTEIYVRAFPGPGGKYQVSSGGGVNPIWSKDGKQLLYRTLREPNKMMVANYRMVTGAFQNDKPQEWSSGTIADRGLATWSSDLSPDGKRFLVLRIPEVAANSGTKNDKFVLILNAFDDLRRKSAPAKP